LLLYLTRAGVAFKGIATNELPLGIIAAALDNGVVELFKAHELIRMSYP